MEVLFIIIISWILIGIVKVFWLFFNRNIMSPYFVRHPSFGLIIAAIILQPVFNVSYYLRNLIAGRTTFIKFLIALLKFFSIIGFCQFFIKGNIFLTYLTLKLTTSALQCS